MITTYFTLEEICKYELKEKGSKFIGISFPILNKDDFELKLNEIKLSFPKASHYCYAYKLDLDGNNYRINDDGEPSGTAGKPIFGQLEANSLTNVGLVVVRYFGGTKLGVPGLIQSYKTCASQSILANKIVKKNIEALFKLKFPETEYEKMQICVGQLKKVIPNISFNSAFEISFSTPIVEIVYIKKIIFEVIFGYTFEEKYENKLEQYLTTY
jgi:uncharacterized YigZ family protein